MKHKNLYTSWTSSLVRNESISS